MKHIDLNVITYNVWALPVIGTKVTERIAALAGQIKMGRIGKDKLRFDILLIQELWTKEEHDKIRANLPTNYHMTGYFQLNPYSCNQMAYQCSGLAIISAYPLSSIKFEMYNDKGYGVDELWVAKGFGQVTIHPTADITVAAFVTHTVAEFCVPPFGCLSFNKSVRKAQLRQMMKIVDKSNADLIIVGGDLNAEPQDGAINIIKRHQMKDSKEDVVNEAEWRSPKYATYGNAKNPYSGTKKPEILDYVFYRTNTKATMGSRAVDFQVPSVALSDHSPVWTKIRTVKHSNK